MYLGHFHFENGVLYNNIKGHAKPIGKYKKLVLDNWESEAKHIKKTEKSWLGDIGSGPLLCFPFYIAVQEEAAYIEIYLN
ncbi:hypothetical protein Q0V21_11725 [Paenibacillus sp. 11B]|uniref:hypothetical protein n=1 Tax=unclassified Paenibacillus TaxID=185978 RepID=UPI002651BE6B|nr:hypothetical protein [Paenibacillus sp. 11B]MDN8589441.1 hypothetical protein [Paenibacillus sp. 11B]